MSIWDIYEQLMLVIKINVQEYFLESPAGSLCTTGNKNVKRLPSIQWALLSYWCRLKVLFLVNFHAGHYLLEAQEKGPTRTPPNFCARVNMLKWYQWAPIENISSQSTFYQLSTEESTARITFSLLESLPPHTQSLLWY